jgi:hypothetical protein
VPGFPLTVTTALSCFHQAPALIPPTQTAVAVLGQPVATATAQIGVVGCVFATAAPQPCVTIRWSMFSTKVTAQGQPLLLMPPPGAGPAPGVCLGPAPQGIPVVKTNQMKVLVT